MILRYDMKIEQEYYYEKQSKAYKTEKECRLKSLCFIYITIDSKSNNYTVKDFHTFTLQHHVLKTETYYSALPRKQKNIGATCSKNCKNITASVTFALLKILELI